MCYKFCEDTFYVPISKAYPYKYQNILYHVHIFKKYFMKISQLLNKIFKVFTLIFQNKEAEKVQMPKIQHCC